MGDKKGGKIPIFGIIWHGIVIGFIVGLWADMLYKHPLLIGILSAFIFYILYAVLWYLLIYRKKKNNA